MSVNMYNTTEVVTMSHPMTTTFPDCNGTTCDYLFNMTPSQMNVTEENIDILRFERLIRHIVPFIFGLIVLSGFVGNVLVIIVVWSNKQMQNTTNILIVSLAFADLSFIVFCVPFTAAGYAMTTWPFGSVWCKIVQYLTHVSAYASVWTLVLMSFDRYLAVVHPITSMRIRNRRNTYIMVLLIWFIICTGNIPILLHYVVENYFYMQESRSACVNEKHLLNTDYNKRFYGFFFAFGYLIPLVLICILYGFLLKRLLYGVVPGGSKRAESIKSKKRVTRMVIIVVVIFAICWLPIQVIFLLQHVFEVKTEYGIVDVAVLFTANCFAYMNSCVNPILYAFLSENFRRSFRRVLCCMRKVYSKFEYERTNIRGVEKDTKESLLNNIAKSEEGKDKNCNSENALQLKTMNTL